MKKSSILLFFSLLFLSLHAQVYLSPEKPGFTEEVTLTYKADEGNGALADCDCDIYAHTGLLTAESSHPGDWKNVVADWGQNLEKLKLTKTGDNTYQLRFNISELYGVPPAGNVFALNFVFRNADGSKVGKAKGEQDIFYYFKKPDFKAPPTTLAESQTFEPEWAHPATIYEVNIRQYTEEGTINAFAEHLPRLREMGVDILWFMPVQPIGELNRKGPLGSYYSIRDYSAINPEFGTMDDFKKLVKTCHGMGFKVVLDWVANHSAFDNAWAEQHPNWYNRNDKGEIIAPYDWTDVADLNYDMYYLRQAMTEAMLFWVKEVDIDGFRCDVAGEVPLDFWEDARAKLDAVKPIWMVAENADQTFLLNKAFNANYGWPFHHLMNEIAKGHTPANKVFDYFENIKNQYPAGSYPMQFITNHDENSWQGTVFERLGDGHKAFATLMFTVPGMPLIYSGQEAGMKKRLKFFEKDPIEWGNYPLVDFYTQLDFLKSTNPALWNGDAGGWIEEIPNDQAQSVVAFSREKDGNQVVLIANLSSTPLTANLQPGKRTGIYREYFTKEKITLGKRSTMELKPWAYKVLIFEEKAPEEKRTFQSIEPTKTGLRINVSDGTINLTMYSNSTLEVEFVPVGEENPPSYAIAPPFENKGLEERLDNLPTDLINIGNRISYQTKGISIHIQKEPFQLSYFYKKKALLAEEQGYFDDGLNKGFRFHLNPEEKLTGGGERVLGMNRRGKRMQLYNKASYGYETHADLMYYSMPVVISSEKYMLVFDNGASGYLDLGATEKDVLQFEAVGGRMSYLIVAADDWPGLAKNFTRLTGRQPMVPRWAMGNITSRMGYHSQKEVEKVIEKYEEDEIPLDCVVLDLFWFGPDIKGHLGNFDWHLDSFPQPQKMLDDMEAKGIKTVLITEPFIIKNSATYEEAMEQQLVGKMANGEPYHYDFYFGNTLLIDLFKPQAQQWFWDIYKKHTLTGVDGWWGDLGEPEVHPDDLLHVNGRADELHNLYGHEWAKTVFGGFAKDFPNERPVILMRSGFVGSQRYGMVPWSGDVNRSWGGLQPQVEIALTMGLQGLAYMHSDLGGFAGDYQDAELYTRWLQYGVFQPIYRTHAQEMVPPEPVFWDDKTKDIVRRYIDLRYQLTPYNYTLLYENTTTGIPLMRPLFYVDDDPALFENTKTYLWGDAFLVSPVVEKGATTHPVYLPKNATWVNFWTDEHHRGGQTISVPVDLDNIPVFVKAGSFVPMTPVFKNMATYTSEKLTVHYFHDASISASMGQMYEDDGKTKDAISKKKYELLQFSSRFANGELDLTISPEGHDYEGKPETRQVQVVVHGLETFKEVTPPSTTSNWDEKSKELTLTFELKNVVKVLSIK
ncbi:MAG: glycoside hydrolase family 31 protein [Saprospiraceae bacterium]